MEERRPSTSKDTSQGGAYWGSTGAKIFSRLHNNHTKTFTRQVLSNRSIKSRSIGKNLEYQDLGRLHFGPFVAKGRFILC